MPPAKWQNARVAGKSVVTGVPHPDERPRTRARRCGLGVTYVSAVPGEAGPVPRKPATAAPRPATISAVRGGKLCPPASKVT
jgi:hypothetical protein